MLDRAEEGVYYVVVTLADSNGTSSTYEIRVSFVCPQEETTEIRTNKAEKAFEDRLLALKFELKAKFASI